MALNKTRPTYPEIGLITLASIIFVTIVAKLHPPPFHDEDDYLQNVTVLAKYGLSNAYLLNLIGSAGPLFSVIHYLFEPLTHLQAPYIRFINVAFLIGAVYFISQIIMTLKTTQWWYSIYIMAIPLTYIMGGLALTEMPALFFYCIAIFCAIKAVDYNLSLPMAILFSVIGGLSLSMAILGRQPYLLTLIAFPILFFTVERFKRHVLLLSIFITFSLLIPLRVFWIWQGLVPPEDATLYNQIAEEGTSFQPVFIFNFLFYAALSMFFIAPAFYTMVNKRIVKEAIVVFGIALILNLIFSYFLFLPVRTMLKPILPVSMIFIAERFFGAAVITAGAFFLRLLIKYLKDLQYRKEVAFFVVAILLLALSCGKITWGFSSRYTAQSVPLLIGLGSYFYRNSSWNIVRIALGVTIGLLSITLQYMGVH